MSNTLKSFPYDTVVEQLLGRRTSEVARQSVPTLIPFFGSGASLVFRGEQESWMPDDVRRWKYPSANELARFLVMRADPTLVSDFGHPFSEELSKSAHYSELKQGRPTMRDELFGIFRKVEETPDSPLHDAVALIDRPVVFTTNYDTLIEASFEKRHRKYKAIVEIMDYSATTIQATSRSRNSARASESANSVWVITNNGEGVSSQIELVPKSHLNVDAYLSDGYAVVYKMHGGVLDSADRSQFLISDNDYIRYMSGGQEKGPLPSTIFAYAERRGFLFLGYSLKDWNFRLVFARLRSIFDARAKNPEAPRKSYAVMRQTSEIDQYIWDHNGVNVYAGDLTEFGRDLKRRMEGV
jgi:hypothetical protein